MKALELTTRVGPDGTVTVPVPPQVAPVNGEVRITIQSSEEAGSTAMTQTEWQAFIESTAGSIPDASFRRHDQGTLEGRESWS